MEIRQNGQINPTEWDDFLENIEGTTPYQLWDWKYVYQSSYGLKTYQVAAYSNGQISGILPLVDVNNPLTGRYLTTPPGGIAYQDEQISKVLLEYATELAQKLGVEYLAIRDGVKQIVSSKLNTVDGHYTFVLDIEDCAKADFACLSRKTRQKVNRSVREGLTYKVGNHLIDEFYRVYLRAMRERGTPTQGINFFKSILDKFSNRAHLIVLYWEGVIVGGGFVFDFANTLYCAWSALLKDYYSLYTSSMLFWASIEQALYLEKEKINLGRSALNSGSYFFKSQWTKQTTPLFQQYYLNKISVPPLAGNDRSDSLFFKAFTSVWQHLPLPVTEVVGPNLRKRVPFG